MVASFAKDEKLDEQALRGRAQFLIENGTCGLMINGSTGETANLSPEERKRIIGIAVDEAEKKFPVIARTGASSTNFTVILTHAHAKACRSALTCLSFETLRDQ